MNKFGKEKVLEFLLTEHNTYLLGYSYTGFYKTGSLKEIQIVQDCALANGQIVRNVLGNIGLQTFRNMQKSGYFITKAVEYTNLIHRFDLDFTRIGCQIIAGFPGVGKTFTSQNNESIIDSDSQEFSWLVLDGIKQRNPEFPKNYLQHIKKNMLQYKYVFVSSHKTVRNALSEAGIHYCLVYPDIALKHEYLQRYKERGSEPGFIELISNNWDNWILECQSEIKCNKITLQKGEYISDKINFNEKQ